MKRPHPSIQAANVITGGGGGYVCLVGTPYIFCCYYVFFQMTRRQELRMRAHR